MKPFPKFLIRNLERGISYLSKWDFGLLIDTIEKLYRCMPKFFFGTYLVEIIDIWYSNILIE